MSPLVRYSLIAIAAAAAAFGITHAALRSTRVSSETRGSGTAETTEFAWLQSEFRLTAEQTSAVAKLHDDYDPVCMTHCRAIIKARAKLSAAPASEQPAARAELTRLEAVCHDATLAHLKRVAAVMSPDQGARFLALVEPKLSGQNHAAPLGLK